MGNKKKKIDKYARRRLVLKIIIVIIILILLKLIFFKTQNNYYEDTVLIIGDKQEQLDNRIIVDSIENIYMSYDDVKKIYDENIYYDDVNKILVTTYNKHVAQLQLDSKEIIINDAQSTMNGSLKYMEDELYLPISDMALVYDFEYNYSQDTNTVIIDSISSQKSTATVLKNTSIKKGKCLFSKKLEKLSEDDTVVVLENDEKYYKVRTDDGIIGYVKSKKLSDVNVVRNDMQDSKLENVNILENYSSISDTYETIELDESKYNVVIPKLLNIIEGKEVENTVTKTSEKYQKYEEWLNNNNINLWATITTDIDVSEMMLTYNDRNVVINNIYSKLVENNYKVLNIDFEKINDINSFYRFLIELVPRLREAGIKTVVTYNSSMNEEKVRDIVDYIVKED